MMVRMDRAEHRAYHALALRYESAYAKLSSLKEHYGGWTAALQAEDIDPAPSDWRELETLGIRIVLREDPDYPAFLKEIPHPPHALYIRGALPGKEGIAIVGTRKATCAGKETARAFARALAPHGVPVVSGLAFGIDAAAHAGAIEDSGITVGILACGLDKLYPASNTRLGQKILERGGALASEYPPRTPPLPYRFLERNRIVSGLSRAVLVIEAPERSGAIATARFAVEQNRDVFVVPGPAAHPNFKGSHALIREGATLVTTPAELMADLGYTLPSEPVMNEDLPADEALVRAALRSAARPLAVDEIIELTMLEPRIVNQTLSLLVIKNVIREEGAGYAI